MFIYQPMLTVSNPDSPPKRKDLWVRDYTDAIQSTRSINQGNDFVRSNYDPKGALIGTKFHETFILKMCLIIRVGNKVPRYC